jgi:putative ABC transport system permease protein
MIKNLFRVALRNLIKDGWFSLLNILGLTIGITFSLFLIFYVRDELSYDRYNENAGRICRIVSYVHEKDKNSNWAITAFPLGPVVKKELPGVEEAVRLVPRGRTLFKQGNNSFYESKVYYADSNIFNVFTLKFLAGQPANALSDRNSIVISKTIAEKYFGRNTEVIGQTLNVGDELRTITGMIEDVPSHSHIRYDMLIPMSSKKGIDGESWSSLSYYTYILLAPGATPEGVLHGLEKIDQKYITPVFTPFNVKIDLGLQKITDIHLHSNLQWEPEELGSMSYIWIFSAVAFFMLLTASINYMNLTTARSARRAKEIGIRKVAGSTRRQLALQFLSESIVTSLIAVLLSFLLVLLLCPTFNSLSGKSFTIGDLLQPDYFFLVLGIGLFTGFVGGCYPAFYLSGFRPVGILKGALSKASGNIHLRRTLVVLQFSVSMVMLICTWVVYSQLAYLRKRDLGFNKDQVMLVTVDANQDERGRIAAMKDEFAHIPGVRLAATGDSYPGGGNVSLDAYSFPIEAGHVNEAVATYHVDEHYLDVLGIPIVHGRNFSGPADTLHSILVNETLVRHFGWKEPIGKRVQFPGDPADKFYEVVGVCKDFNQKSLYDPITPLVLAYGSDNNIIQVKMDVAHSGSPIAETEGIWKKYFPELPFQFKFLDQDLQSQYEADVQRGKIFASFSVLTILITCMGLLGLTAFVTQQKQKEISIRRVMGASIAQILALVAGNYVWLTLIAACVAFPIAYYFMHRWLDVFAYHTNLSFLPFLNSAMVIVVIVVLTVSFHGVKAAMANPAKKLRSE